VAGDMQIIFDVEPKAIRQIDSADGVSLSSIPAGAYNGICGLKNSMPGSNADFVKGLQFTQDRERIVNRVFRGHGSIGNNQPIMSAYGPDFWHRQTAQKLFSTCRSKRCLLMVTGALYG
jgi:peptide/nickel transport system substrate-binding protein